MHSRRCPGITNLHLREAYLPSLENVHHNVAEIQESRHASIALPKSTNNTSTYCEWHYLHHVCTNSSNSNERLTELKLTDHIERLWKARGKAGRAYMLDEAEMTALCRHIRRLFLSQPSLIDLQGSMKVVGDVHGQYADLLNIFELCGKPDDINYLFLGDYVDRGPHSLETISLLFCYKLKYPERFFLLRGNHESQSITRIYGFYDECKRRFSVRLWRTFVDTFNCMPFVAIIEDQVFCCHGGLSPVMLSENIPTLKELKIALRSLVRPCEVHETGIICDILWSDPWYLESNNDREPSGWQPSERGVSYMFGPSVVDAFLERFGLDLIVRAHQVIQDGYEFYANRSLVTIFSAPNYCGEFDNAAAVFCLSRKMADEPQTPQNSLRRDTPEAPEETELEGSFQIIRSKVARKKK